MQPKTQHTNNATAISTERSENGIRINAKIGTKTVQEQNKQNLRRKTSGIFPTDFKGHITWS
jgi:hypothetical protein